MLLFQITSCEAKKQTETQDGSSVCCFFSLSPINTSICKLCYRASVLTHLRHIKNHRAFGFWRNQWRLVPCSLHLFVKRIKHISASCSWPSPFPCLFPFWCNWGDKNKILQCFLFLALLPEFLRALLTRVPHRECFFFFFFFIIHSYYKSLILCFQHKDLTGNLAMFSYIKKKKKSKVY